MLFDHLLVVRINGEDFEETVNVFSAVNSFEFTKRREPTRNDRAEYSRDIDIAD